MSVWGIGEEGGFVSVSESSSSAAAALLHRGEERYQGAGRRSFRRIFFSGRGRWGEGVILASH